MPLKVNLAHHPLDAFGVDLDLGHVLRQDPAGYVLHRGWSMWLMRMRLAIKSRRRS
jgi:hypothetical protein